MTNSCQAGAEAKGQDLIGVVFSSVLKSVCSVVFSQGILMIRCEMFLLVQLSIVVTGGMKGNYMSDIQRCHGYNILSSRVL